MKILSSRCNSNLSNCKLIRKRFRCFEVIRIHDLCASAVALYQLGYEDQYNVRTAKDNRLCPRQISLITLHQSHMNLVDSLSKSYYAYVL